MDYCQVDLYRDIYTYNSDTAAPVQTKPAGEGYTELLTWLDDYLAEYTVSDPEKNEIDVGEKRIGAPTIIKVEDGKPVSKMATIGCFNICRRIPGKQIRSLGQFHTGRSCRFLAGVSGNCVMYRGR